VGEATIERDLGDRGGIAGIQPRTREIEPPRTQERHRSVVPVTPEHRLQRADARACDAREIRAGDGIALERPRRDDTLADT
jgi:hypothetical protein